MSLEIIYDTSNNFVNGLNTTLLHSEITNSSIGSKFSHIDVIDITVKIKLTIALTGPELVILNNIVANHDPTAVQEQEPVVQEGRVNETTTEIDLSGSSLELTSNVTKFLNVKATIGSDTVKLPNATTLENGWTIVINNKPDSETHLTIVDYNGGYVMALGTNNSATIFLKNNSTSSGNWDSNCTQLGHIITVGHSGAQFTSITSALASITDNSGSSRYIIKVAPGIYYEGDINLKQYVSICGTSRETCIVVADPSANSYIVKMSDQSELRGLEFKGLEQAGGIGILMEACNHAYIVDCEIEHCETLVYVHSTSIPIAQSKISDCDLKGRFKYGIHCDGRDAGSGGTSSDILHMTLSDNIIRNETGVLHGLCAEGIYVNIIDIGTHYIGTVKEGTCLHITDGANIRFLSVSIGYWDVGLNVPSIGVSPKIDMISINIHDIGTSDIEIEHPGTSGTLSGIFARSKTNINPNITALSINYLDSVDRGTVMPGDIYVGNNNDDAYEIVKLFNTLPTGIISGGELDLSGMTINISDGYGYVHSNNTNQYKEISWTNASIVLDSNDYNKTLFIYYDSNGTILKSQTIPNRLSNLVLCRVVLNSTGVDFVDKIGLYTYHYSVKQFEMNYELFGTRVASGLIHNVDLSGSRTIEVSSGVYYYSINRFTPSGGSPISFTEYYHNGAGNFVSAEVSIIEVNNTQYDTSTGLLAIPAGKYVKHSLYMVGDGDFEKYMFVYGRTYYDTQGEAEEGSFPSPPLYFDNGVILIAGIVIQEGNPYIVSTSDERPTSVAGGAGGAGGISGTTDHGGLQGLLDDDHPQYINVNGIRAMNGSLDMGNQNIINVNLVDGVNIETHASRHLPLGVDPLTTAAGTTLSVTTTNSIGAANSFSRSDHGHLIDITTSNGLATKETIQTLTNKTLTAPIINSGTINTITINNADLDNVKYLSLEDGSGSSFKTIIRSDSTNVADRTLTIDLNDTNCTLATFGNITFNGIFYTGANLTFNDPNPTTIRTIGTTDITLPTTGTLITTTGTNTLTNKTINDATNVVGMTHVRHNGGSLPLNLTQTPTANQILRVNPTGTQFEWVNLAAASGTTVISLGGGIPETVNATVFTVAKTGHYPGSGTVGSISSVKIIVSSSNTGGVWSIRLFDVTNALTIATITGLTGLTATPIIVNLGVIANVPVSDAILEIQAQRTAGTGVLSTYHANIIC